jgi:hypothetical protein
MNEEIKLKIAQIALALFDLKLTLNAVGLGGVEAKDILARLSAALEALEK